MADYGKQRSLENDVRTQINDLDKHAGLMLELIENTENPTLQNIEEICEALQDMITTYQEEMGYI